MRGQRQVQRVWPGYNSFCCFGKCMRGPISDTCPLVTGWLSLIAAGAVFGGLVAPYLWTANSPAWGIVGGILWLWTAYQYASACFTDPGIIPRRSLAAAIAYSNPEWWDRRANLLLEQKRKSD